METPEVYVAPSPIDRRGLFAKTLIKKGAYIGTYKGPIVKRNGSHVLWVEQQNGSWLGRSGRNKLRFVNHSNRPNADFVGFDLYAIKTIKPGSEITFNYGAEWKDK